MLLLGQSSRGLLRLGHHEILDLKGRPEILLFDEPGVDNLPLLLRVFKLDLDGRNGLANALHRLPKPIQVRGGKGTLTSNLRSKLGTTL